MNQHAMKYVGMADRVAAEMSAQTKGLTVPELLTGSKLKLIVGGKIVADNLFRAEVGLVSAYRTWRDYMERAAENGSDLAKQYLEETVWDLT